MTVARDRADRKGSTPIQIGSLKLDNSSDNLSVTNASGTPKKLIASEIEIGDSSNKVIIKKGSDNKVAFQTQASGGSATDSNAGGGVTVYANAAALQAASGTAEGDLGFVTDTKKLMIRTSTGWYFVATVTNATPVINSAGNASYTFATNGTAVVIDVSATEPEGETITYAYQVTAGSLTNGGGATATVVQGTGANINRFTITPSTNSSYAGSFTLKFSATDPNSNIALSSASVFSLSFTTTSGAYDFTAKTARITLSSSEFNIGSSEDFTYEFWYYVPSSPANGVYFFDIGSGNTFILHHYGSYLSIYSSAMTSFNLSNGVGTANTTWFHCAIARSGSSIKVYIDGTQAGSGSSSSALTGSQFRFNGYGGGGYADTGLLHYVSDARLVVGTCVYSGNFAKPTGSLTTTGGTYSSTTNVNTSITSSHTKLLTAQNSSGSLVDNSSFGHSMSTTVGTITPRAGVP
tara:strand:- start:157 stop:1548 length:1392 start_codon:yes stop_codon:yes gene_type:complete